MEAIGLCCCCCCCCLDWFISGWMALHSSKTIRENDNDDDDDGQRKMFSFFEGYTWLAERGVGGCRSNRVRVWWNVSAGGCGEQCTAAGCLWTDLLAQQNWSNGSLVGRRRRQCGEHKEDEESKLHDDDDEDDDQINNDGEEVTKSLRRNEIVSRKWMERWHWMWARNKRTIF